MVELSGVVVAVTELERVVGQLVPLLAGNLTGLAADTEGRVGEESNRFSHASVPQQIRRDLGQPLVSGVQVKRQRGNLVHDRNRPRLAAKVEGQQVVMAALAAVDANMRELFLLLEDGQPGGVGLTAAGAGHTRKNPGVSIASIEGTAGR